MYSKDRIPHERAGNKGDDTPVNTALAAIHADLTQAFTVCEQVGEAKGRLAGQALAKLTEDERRALGLCP
jgi:hypothetical protein